MNDDTSRWDPESSELFERWKNVMPRRVGEGLECGDRQVPPAHLRASIFESTRPTVRRLRWRHRAVTVVFCVCVYGIGVASAGLWTGDERRAVQTDEKSAGGASGDSPADQLDAPDTPDWPGSDVPPHPLELAERLRGAGDVERREAFRRAGDVYLSPARADPAAAVACYSRALATSGNVTTNRVAQGDSWLFAALKLARGAADSTNRRLAE